jgi:8-amino-7-oxononanoate synthase
MNSKVISRIQTELNSLKMFDSYRILSPNDEKLVDFCSNDYLGLIRSNTLGAKVKELFSSGECRSGSGGSRLLTGNTKFYQEVETRIAQYHRMESCLVLGCGYMANLAVLSTLPRRTDTILYDELCHASIRDGVRLSLARNLSYRHNDYEDLYTKARVAEGCVWVVTESIFSMDGDAPDFKIISDICRSNEATLIVDEAHALGVCGEDGKGLASEVADIMILGFGKAAGAYGGAILSSKTVVEYLINRARPFIYSTAPPPNFWRTLYAFYELFPHLTPEKKTLNARTSLFKEALYQVQIPFLGGDGGIVSVVIPGNNAVKKAAQNIRAMGYDVRPILYPTVPKDKERIRVCVHSFNTPEQIKGLANILKQVYEITARQS